MRGWAVSLLGAEVQFSELKNELGMGSGDGHGCNSGPELYAYKCLTRSILCEVRLTTIKNSFLTVRMAFYEAGMGKFLLS